LCRWTGKIDHFQDFRETLHQPLVKRSIVRYPEIIVKYKFTHNQQPTVSPGVFQLLAWAGIRVSAPGHIMGELRFDRLANSGNWMQTSETHTDVGMVPVDALLKTDVQR